MSNRIKPGARGGAYHRVSDLGGRDPDAEGYVTERQAWDEIDAWKSMRKVTIAPEHYYCDRDESGSKMYRPEFDRMIDDLRNGVIDFIVIAKVDRLSRADVGSAMLRVREIHEIAPGALAILDLGLDPATKMGEMVLTVLLALARMQWRGYQENWLDVQTRAIARGVWIGPAPFGYRATVLGEHPNGKVIHGPLEPDPDTGPIVTQAFKLAGTDGLHTAMNYLRTHAPDRRWRTYEVRKLLASRAYLGEAWKGDISNPKAHPPLVTPKVWLAAQTEPRTRRSNSDYLLTGLVHCACGAHMKGGSMGGRNGARLRRYRCSQCNTSVNTDLIEPYLRGALKAALGDKQVRDRFAPVGVDDARDEWQDAEAERERYLSDLDARKMAGSDDAWRAGLKARADDAEGKRDTYQSLVSQATHYERLPLAAELDDDEQFTRALVILNRRGTVTIARGHGTIAERVTFTLDGEVMPGAPLALQATD